MPKIFISYRREDASAHAGRLFDRLSAQYGKERIFMDIDSIEPGADFGEAIERTVASCEVCIAVIGSRWLAIKDAEGARRLDNPDDFVRLEVASALERKIRVIPLLVGNAQMPRSDDLPEPLRGLARRNAFEVSDIGFHENITRLIRVLDQLDQANRTSTAPATTNTQAQASAAAPADSPSVPAVKPIPLSAQVAAQPEAVIAPAPEPPAKHYKPIANPPYTVITPSLGKALFLHLLFGFGLWYAKPEAKRKYAYPAVCAYGVFDVAMAANHIEPFHTEAFGATTFYISIVLFVVGFIDVAITCLRRKKVR